MHRPASVLLITAVVLFAAACSDGEAKDGGTTEATAETTTTVVAAEKPSAVGLSSGTVTSAGLERDYLLVVPESYDGGTAVPLVMVFHGYTMTASEQLAASGFEDLAEEEGFIAVFPEGRGDLQRWLFELDEVDIDISTANPDMALVGDLLDHLTQQLNIDSTRIFAAGFSNGGWMTSAIACTMPDEFTAVAPVAGIMDFGDQCQTTDALPMVTFHGRVDAYEPFVGGVENAPSRGALPTDLGGTYDELPMIESPIFDPSVPDKVARWAQRNGCEAEPSSTPLEDTVTTWVYDCAAPVVLYDAADGAHWWDLEIAFDTNRHLWEFFGSASP